jgi:hypothetical protein
VGSFQLDDTRQTVRATVGPGVIEITDPTRQAALEQAGTPLSELNRDPDRAMEITKDKHIDLEIYLSGESIKAAIKAGAAITEIIAGALNHVKEPALAKAIGSKELDPADALRQLQSGSCGEQRGDASFWLWEWIVPSAHAADCIIKTLKGEPIVIQDRAGCIEALGKALYSQVIGVPLNAQQFSGSLLKGAAEQGEEFIALVSDPSGLIKSVSGVALEFYQDPKAAAAKYGLELAGSLQEKSLLYVKALANGDYDTAGKALSGLAIELSIKLAAPVAGAGLSAIKVADKINALKKLEKINTASQPSNVIANLTAIDKAVSDHFDQQRKFWTQEPVIINGNRVYQRNDLIDPVQVDSLGRTNLDRMKNGLAPIGPDGKSINLHHMTQSADGALAELTQTLHQSNGTVLHINPNAVPSGIDRDAFAKWRSDYWKLRAKNWGS